MHAKKRLGKLSVETLAMFATIFVATQVARSHKIIDSDVALENSRYHMQTEESKHYRYNIVQVARCKVFVASLIG